MRKGLEWLISLSLVLMVGVLFSTRVNAEVNVTLEDASNSYHSWKVFNVNGDGELTRNMIIQEAEDMGYELSLTDEIVINGIITINEGNFSEPITSQGNVIINGGEFIGIEVANGNLTINGGNIDELYFSKGNLTINNGNIKVLDMESYFSGNVVMNGGRITGINDPELSANRGTVLMIDLALNSDKVKFKGGSISGEVAAIEIVSDSQLDPLTIASKLVPKGYKISSSEFEEEIIAADETHDILYVYYSAKEITIEKEAEEEKEPTKEETKKEENKKEESKKQESKKEETKKTDSTKDLTTTDSKGPKANISAEKSFPAGSKLSVKSMNIPESIKKSEKNIKKIYDISVLNSNAEIIPVSDNKMNITIDLDEDLKGYKAYEVVYIKDGKVVERIPATVKDGKLTFTTNHLSEYGVVAYNTVKTGDNILVYASMLIISVLGLGIVTYKKVRQ